MSEELLMKSVMSVIISGILAYDCWVREKRETDPELKDENSPRYATATPVLMLPCIILMIFGISMTRLGLRECVEVIMALCFEIFLQISTTSKAIINNGSTFSPNTNISFVKISGNSRIK